VIVRAVAIQIGGRWLQLVFAALALSGTITSAQAAAIDACNNSSFESVPQSEKTSAKIVATDLRAQAYWLNRNLIQWPKVAADGRFRLYAATNETIVATVGAQVTGSDQALDLKVFSGAVPTELSTRFKFVADGVRLRLPPMADTRSRNLHRGQLMLVKEDASGRVVQFARLQIPGALDDWYASAARESALGVTIQRKGNASTTQFKLWAPTARAVSLCLFRDGTAKATQRLAMRLDEASGVWTSKLANDRSGGYYTYLVEVNVAGVGRVQNRATDPYSISLTTDSKRSYIADLNSAALKPKAWDTTAAPTRVKSATDMVIYELHLRDFSINDATASADQRGKYGAFAEPNTNSNGMKHLRALSAAGLTDVHLLPVFDIATIPEAGCSAAPVPMNAAPDSDAQQTAALSSKARDCFNWGYDPFHFTVPEGSYATNAADGAVRIREFRQMVQSLHQAGLRVGMDVVYNHTSAAGQQATSVLDRIVPGYYHRLNAEGGIETSTCCANTATEHLMMGKLMIDSVVTWAKHYKIDSFRFDLMAHQPRDTMLRLKQAVNAAVGHDIQLLGEGWNFGEVADGARFVQASQLQLNGTAVGTFSDRARDAVRGGGPMDGGSLLGSRQGYVNGLGYDRNEQAPVEPNTDALLRAADMVRVGLAGSIRDYVMTTYRDQALPLEKIDYNGQPAGYVREPTEVVNYIENHDNHTLFDNNAFKLPVTTSREDRARVQILAAAINMFSQGTAYFHAGVDTLRSKSMDRNSYDSGDWFNRIDWTYRDNYFGTGLPPKTDNENDWPVSAPLLRNASIKPTQTEIEWTRDAFKDLLQIRASTPLFRLPTAAEIKQRLTFHNVGSAQIPTVLVGHLSAANRENSTFQSLAYFINVDTVAQQISVAALAGQRWVLHPVHLKRDAADKRIAATATVDTATGTFTLPPRAAVVFVAND
jgi:pullulanase